MLPFVLLLGGPPACGAAASRADVAAAELQAESARAEATREHAQLIEIEARLIEMEQRLASRTRTCEATYESSSAGVTSPHDEPKRDEPKPEPPRSEGDFLAEARVKAPAAAAPPARIATSATPGAAPESERERLEQLLQGLRDYADDRQSGLSLERREALRVLLRRERQLDLMNPWAER